MQSTVVKRFPLVFMPDMGCSIEYTDEHALFHFEYITKVTPSMVKFLQWYTEEVLEFVIDMGYDHLWGAIPIENIKVQKLARLMGFEYLEDKDGFAIYRR